MNADNNTRTLLRLQRSLLSTPDCIVKKNRVMVQLKDYLLLKQDFVSMTKQLYKVLWLKFNKNS